jgi:hypothetical protein
MRDEGRINKFMDPGKMFGVSRLAGLFYVETSRSAESRTRMKLPDLSLRIVLPVLTAALLASGCSRYYAAPAYIAAPAGAPPQVAAGPVAPPLRYAPSVAAQSTTQEKMGYAIQVGAFTRLDNAVRLERLLKTRGVDAFYIRHESGR